MSVPEINFDGIPEAVQRVLESHTEPELSELSGVSQPVINRLACGVVVYPNVRTLKNLWPFIGKYMYKDFPHGKYNSNE